MHTLSATDLIEEYRKNHSVYPDKLTFNLWATEIIRHEGVMESQILSLVGIRPKWDERGRVSGVDPIPRPELERQRIDVTIVSSGLYRDIFPFLMNLLDNRVAEARDQAEEDNLVRANTLKTMELLKAKGIAEDKARRLASVRIFTEPPGAYGTNLDKVIVASNTWDNEQQVADIYFMLIFYTMGQEGMVDSARIMTGLALSLKATAAELVVAIPSVILYNLLLRRAKELLLSSLSPAPRCRPLGYARRLSAQLADQFTLKAAYEVSSTTKADLSFRRSTYGWGYGTPRTALRNGAGPTARFVRVPSSPATAARNSRSMPAA